MVPICSSGILLAHRPHKSIIIAESLVALLLVSKSRSGFGTKDYPLLMQGTAGRSRRCLRIINMVWIKHKGNGKMYYLFVLFLGFDLSSKPDDFPPVNKYCCLRKLPAGEWWLILFKPRDECSSLSCCSYAALHVSIGKKLKTSGVLFVFCLHCNLAAHHWWLKINSQAWC